MVSHRNGHVQGVVPKPLPKRPPSHVLVCQFIGFKRHRKQWKRFDQALQAAASIRIGSAATSEEITAS